MAMWSMNINIYPIRKDGVSESEVRDFIHELLNHVWFNFSHEFRAEMKTYGIYDDDMIF